MFPSPNVFEIIALPPVPIIKPIVPIIIIAGIIKFIDANALFPTTFETNIPSTTPYIDVNTIIIIVGNVNFINFLYVKCSDKLISTFFFSKPISLSVKFSSESAFCLQRFIFDSIFAYTKIFIGLYSFKMLLAPLPTIIAFPFSEIFFIYFSDIFVSLLSIKNSN